MQKQKKLVAERLNWLFENIDHPDGREYKQSEIEDLTEQEGLKVSTSYIGRLRNGKADNPSWEVLSVLATVFGVPLTFFFEELSTKEMERYKLASSLQDEDVAQIALRSRKLSDSQRKTILDVINGMTGDNED